jgi:hypothetical protein
MRAFDQDTFKPLIVERIALGEFIEDFAGANGWPAKSTIRDWLMADSAFRLQCARAREASAGIFEKRVVDLAHKVERGEIDPKAGAAAGNLLTWICKVRNRRVYGDKVEVDATVSVGGAILERLSRARGRVLDGAGEPVDALAVDAGEAFTITDRRLETAA